MRIRRSWDDRADEMSDKGAEELVWRIQIDGRFVVTSSNKTFWKKKGHAMAALRLEFEACFREETRRVQRGSGVSFAESTWTYREAVSVVEEEYQKFIKERVRFSEYVLI